MRIGYKGLKQRGIVGNYNASKDYSTLDENINIKVVRNPWILGIFESTANRIFQEILVAWGKKKEEKKNGIQWLHSFTWATELLALPSTELQVEHIWETVWEFEHLSLRHLLAFQPKISSMPLDIRAWSLAKRSELKVCIWELLENIWQWKCCCLMRSSKEWALSRKEKGWTLQSSRLRDRAKWKYQEWKIRTVSGVRGPFSILSRLLEQYIFPSLSHSLPFNSYFPKQKECNPPHNISLI